MRYDYTEYWNERGQTPAATFSPDKRHFIDCYLQKLEFNSVLEIGCGNGELTEIIFMSKPVAYIGIDLSEDRLKLHKVRFQRSVIQADITKDLAVNLPLADLVICSHTLLHIKPEHIKDVIKNMVAHAAKHIIFFETNPAKDLGEWEYYNFNHDYESICKELGYTVKFTRFDYLTGIYHIDKN